MLLVTLNPQPEPPMLPDLSLLDPSRPVLSVASNENPNFRILFGIGDDVPLGIDATGTPDAQGHYEFFVRHATGGLAFTVLFDIGTSSGGVPNPDSWTWLNPQPEPPLPSEGIAGICFDFQFTSTSEATLTMEVRDPLDNRLAFSQVPEPSALVLWSLFGAFAITAGRWRRWRAA
jgi:hypothetical protein